jgi:uncharacterized protein
MSGERFFLETFFVQALLNPRDQYHERAKRFEPRLDAAAEVWVTEAVLVEVADGLSALNRDAAVAFVRASYRTPNIRVIPVDTALLDRALDLYEARPDKTWGQTDCITFVVMEDQGLTDALTGDAHFRQAGYRTLLADTR